MRLSDGRSGTPLLHEQNSRGLPSAADLDRGRPGHRTPRRISDDAAPTSASVSASASAALLPRPRPPPPGGRTLSRQSSFRSRSLAPTADDARVAVRRRYAYASVFLVLSLVSFTVQTELAAWVQHAGWNKAYCMLYLTHGSWSLLWPVQLVVLRLQKRAVPWASFWRQHVWVVRTTAVMVQTRDLDAPQRLRHHHAHHGRPGHASQGVLGRLFGNGPAGYILWATVITTCALTVAGLSWYVAVDMTSPSDLTAIYNCSAFFAYAFSVPLLKERLRLDKSLAVLVAVAGVLVVAYGDGSDGSDGSDGGSSGGRRLLGNLIIGGGSVLYGLYEVLYKRLACPPDGCSAGRGVIFANTFGSCIGVFTLTVLWIPLPLLHVLGIETFVLPTGKVAWYLFLSVVMNATFAGSFLVMISLTSPVLSSVASLLTIFIVAVSDWLLTGQPPSAAALLGGGMIVIAFALLSWSTYKEMAEEQLKSEIDIASGDDDDDDNDNDDNGESDGHGSDGEGRA